MKFLALVLFSVTLMAIANANENMVCDPDKLSNEATLFCNEPKKKFVIKIKKFTSPKTCSKADYKERMYANVTEMDRQTEKIKEYVIDSKDFIWSINRYNATFSSAAFNLNLVDCTSPSTGGFSIGN